MSIFPKRSKRGQSVTIHWNFNTSHLIDQHLCPYVRIGVRRPDGEVSMLLEDYVLALPNPSDEIQAGDSSDKEVKPKYLRKHTPFTVLHDYVSSVIKREALADILGGIVSGRHYYFNYAIGEDAPLGKYTLISEVYNAGNLRLSKTRQDDFFWVEEVQHTFLEENNGRSRHVIKNCSPEATPVKILEWFHDGEQVKTALDMVLLDGNEEKEVEVASDKSFLLYNEEREIIPLIAEDMVFPIRNQKLIPLEKGECLYLLSNEKEDIFELSKEQISLWKLADGVHSKSQLMDLGDELAYQELIEHNVIFEKAL
ncbi:hypothetical protein [Aureibacter tunicatorum]|uniref:Uncharacterized protein n=1 Tax=Aureibacter tunicatorum TaxID=866807 RepID=A0AAE3XUM5_9BACT|nr:hypothetical protein [Aureibacter tunicatorum]MDR6242029.1 hypothetical protein [Aureibacter tunicatorum]BDD07126.1 hypothetical protein AUTU_46090 [Aureibacter tunicatorum]